MGAKPLRVRYGHLCWTHRIETRLLDFAKVRIEG